MGGWACGSLRLWTQWTLHVAARRYLMDHYDELVDQYAALPHQGRCAAGGRRWPLTWVAYASHEGTVAFGGQLAAALPTLWPDLDRWRWSP